MEMAQDSLEKMTPAKWEERKHPRKPGGKGGGQFAPKGEGEGQAAPDEPKKPPPERKVEGPESELYGHKGVFVDIPDRDWTVFVRDGETLEEAYARQVEEAVAGEWGDAAQQHATRLQREDRRKRRAEERAEREAEREAARGTGRTPKQHRIVEDAKKAMIKLGATRAEAEAAVEEAVKIIGITDPVSLLQVAYGSRSVAPGRMEEIRPREGPPAPVTPEPEVLEVDDREEFEEAQREDPEDVEGRENLARLYEQVFGEPPPEERKPEEPKEPKKKPDLLETAVPERVEDEIEAEIEEEEVTPEEEEFEEAQEAKPDPDLEEVSTGRLEEILEEIADIDVGDITPPRFSPEQEAAWEAQAAARKKEEEEEEARAKKFRWGRMKKDPEEKEKSMSDEKNRSPFHGALERAYEAECMGDDFCECAEGKCRCGEQGDGKPGLGLRLRQHGNILRPADFAKGEEPPEEKEDLGSLMLPGWASQESPVSAPREVPRGRIFGDELNEAFDPTVGKADWEERKHPRGKGGKFAPKGTTKPAAEPKAEAKGARPLTAEGAQKVHGVLDKIEADAKAAREKYDESEGEDYEDDLEELRESTVEHPDLSKLEEFLDRHATEDEMEDVEHLTGEDIGADPDEIVGAMIEAARAALQRLGFSGGKEQEDREEREREDAEAMKEDVQQIKDAIDEEVTPAVESAIDEFDHYDDVYQAWEEHGKPKRGRQFVDRKDSWEDACNSLSGAAGHMESQASSAMGMVDAANEEKRKKIEEDMEDIAEQAGKMYGERLQSPDDGRNLAYRVRDAAADLKEMLTSDPKE